MVQDVGVCDRNTWARLLVLFVVYAENRRDLGLKRDRLVLKLYDPPSHVCTVIG